jgi:hypothetical protein
LECSRLEFSRLGDVSAGSRKQAHQIIRQGVPGYQHWLLRSGPGHRIFYKFLYLNVYFGNSPQLRSQR